MISFPTAIFSTWRGDYVITLSASFFVSLFQRDKCPGGGAPLFVYQSAEETTSSRSAVA